MEDHEAAVARVLDDLADPLADADSLVALGHRVVHGGDRFTTATVVDDDMLAGEEGQLRYLLEQIERRRAELEQRRQDIEDTLTELDEVERRCREALTAADAVIDQRG